MSARGSTRASVLVVDDDDAVAMVLTGLLRQGGFDAHHVDRAEAALAHVRREPVDVVLTDLRMPGMDGLALLSALKAELPDLPVVMLTAHGDVATAVEAMKRGAADFLTKPFDREAVLFTLRKASTSAPREVVPARPVITQRPLLGRSPAMTEVQRLVERAAKVTSTVLIRGESGTGKEVVARAIHDASPRRAAPFIPVHCAALPDQLLESELFGYERGAFTGAATRKPGRVELAQGGTLFLDEIGDVPLAVQVKLLRLLQEKTFQPLGGMRELRADVRFLAATHRDLDRMVADETFREDLFYRLDVLSIALPTLAERGDDVKDLAVRLCELSCKENGRKPLVLSPAALERMKAHGWPGNVRELGNFVERLVVFCDGDQVGSDDVERELSRIRPPRSGRTRESELVTPTDDVKLAARRNEAERRAVLEALERTGGNRVQAARLLGISRRTLYNRLSEIAESGYLPGENRNE